MSIRHTENPVVLYLFKHKVFSKSGIFCFQRWAVTDLGCKMMYTGIDQ